MIHAIYEDGQIQPLSGIPEDWRGGQELMIEETGPSDDPAEITRWYEELQRLAADVPDQDHDRVMAALEEQKRIGKELMRREMGLEWHNSRTHLHGDTPP
jgi:hypothetical protein